MTLHDQQMSTETEHLQSSHNNSNQNNNNNNKQQW